MSTAAKYTEIVQEVLMAHQTGKFTSSECFRLLRFRVESLDKELTRSQKQNRYYFGVVVKLVTGRLTDLGYERSEISGEAIGNLTREDVHEFLKANFNRADIVGDDGMLLGACPITTSKLSTKDFAAYMERIIKYAAEFLDLEIPNPETEGFTLSEPFGPVKID